MSALGPTLEPSLAGSRPRSATAARRAGIRRAALGLTEERLADRSLTVSCVAAAIGVSERKLQLGLAEAGMRFNVELRELRMERRLGGHRAAPLDT